MPVYSLSTMWVHLYVLLIICMTSLGASQQDIVLTPLQKSRSITHYGDLRLFAGLLQKLRTGQCLKIKAIGASVTDGHYNYTFIPYEETWHQRVKQLLDRDYPCTDGKGHHVSPLARGGAKTRYWVDTLVGRQDVVLKGYDLVFLDTAITQVEQHGWAQQEEETLIAMVVTQPNRAANQSAVGKPPASEQRVFSGIAAMHLVTTTKAYDVYPMWTGVPYEREGDGMFSILPPAQHHGIPIVSAIDAFGPLPTHEAQQWFNRTWFTGWTGDRPDFLHPPPSGHMLLAELVMNYINSVYEHVRDFKGFTLTDYVIREPRFIDTKTRDLYVDGQPVVFGLSYWKERNASFPGNCNGWNWIQDAPKKYGFVTRTPESPCVLYIKPQEVLHISTGELHVQLLKSYEHMGILNITMSTGAADPGSGSCIHGFMETAPVIGSLIADTLWSNHVSLVETESFKFQLPQGAKDNKTCLFLKLTATRTSRAENKLKLIAVSLF